MPRIPLEDNFTDVIAKAQRGLHISDKELCELADVSLEDLNAVKSGQLLDAVIRRVARHLSLGPNALEELAHKRWYPDVPVFPHGFAIFNAPYEDITVNSYLIWDSRSRVAAAFDTGPDASDLLALVRTERLRLQMIFITHAHDDHVLDLKRMVDETGAEVWASEREAPDLPGAKVFQENAHFHIGGIAIKTLATWGHSPGQTSFYVTGLSYPLVVVGDSLFSSSIGGSATHLRDQHRNDVEKILTLPRNTVIASGHGPLTTVSQEKRHNPFFAP